MSGIPAVSHRVVTIRRALQHGYVTVYAPLVSQEVFRRQGQAADRPNLRAVLAEQLTFLEQIESEVEAQGSIRQ